MKNLLLILMISAATVSVLCPAQAQAIDVVFLKNGSIIKGKITEIIPDKSVKIQTAEGSIYAYSMSEVEKVTDEPNLSGVTIFAGISSPIGDFGDPYGERAGLAKTGYTFGIDVSRNLAPNIAWLSSANLSVNRSQFDVSKDWTLGWLLTGWKVIGNPFPNPSPKVEFFGFGQAGLLYVKIPGSWFSSDSILVTEISTPDYTFGFGLGAGMNIGHASLSLRYLSGEPEYDLTLIDIIDGTYYGEIFYSETYYGTRKQPTYCIQFTGGYTF